MGSRVLITAGWYKAFKPWVFLAFLKNLGQ